MGAQVSSCISANCTQDTSHDFSEVLSTSNELDNTLNLDTNVDYSAPHGEQAGCTPRDIENLHARIHGSDAYFDEISSSDTGSQQSVMSTISPTKDRASPKNNRRADSNKNDLIEGLNLNNHEGKAQHMASGDDLYELVSSGQQQELINYAKLNDVDLRTVVFQESWHTCLHVAVLHNQLSMVNYLIGAGVDINAKGKDGLTALGLAYEQSSQDIIGVLINTKAKEFSGSPYSPYALSVASGTRSMRSNSELPPMRPGGIHRTESFDHADGASVSSDAPSGAWNTPRSQLNSAISENRLATQGVTVNSPYRNDMTPSAVFEHPPRLEVAAQDSVRRRMTMLTESLDRLAQTDRHRSFSLPANSPVFAEAKHARSPSDPTAAVPKLAHLDWTPSSEGQTPLSARSGEGSQDTGDSTQSATAATGGASKEKKSKKPFGSRFRKAAGRAMALIVPHRGMPPRPKPPQPSQPARAADLPLASAEARPVLSIAVDTTQESDTLLDFGSPADAAASTVMEAAEQARADEVERPNLAEEVHLLGEEHRSDSTSTGNNESVFTDVQSHD